MTDLPIVCTLTTDAMRTRREALLSDLVLRCEGREELANGFRFRFAAGADTLSMLAHVIEAERQCCRFMRFTVDVEPDEGPIFLALTGPPGTREFVAALFDAP